MNLRELKDRIKSLTRDFDGVIFRDADLNMYINESIGRFQQVIPELKGMRKMRAAEEVPILLPEPYHHLIAIYGASRCFYQDERHYQASNLMNEFEEKLSEMKYMIESGDLDIIDEEGNVVVIEKRMDHVVNTYFFGPDMVRSD